MIINQITSEIKFPITRTLKNNQFIQYLSSNNNPIKSYDNSLTLLSIKSLMNFRFLNTRTPKTVIIPSNRIIIH